MWYTMYVAVINQSKCKNDLTCTVLDIVTTVSGFFICFFQVIRKVDKQTALLDADDPVSQLHKVHVNSDYTYTGLSMGIVH